MKIIDAPQGSAQWIAARLGRVTASRVADLVAKTKSGPSASRANYAAQLIAERLTGQKQESYTNAAMAWGTATEPEARAAYEFRFNCNVVEVGFVEHPTIAMAGASPDGLVGDDGLVEIKAPLTATHLESLLGQSVPSKYIIQVQFQLACTGRQWCDWVSFDPRLPPEMQMFVERIKRNDEHIAELEREITAFLAEIDAKVAELTKRYGARVAA